ncbi:MAG: hypothetical protein ACK5CV_04685 [Bacteroidota bacterium]
MKKITLLICNLFLMGIVFASSPQKITYQAVIRSASNQLISNQSVGIRISILQGTASGPVVYSETQQTNSNANGLISIEIGGGNVISGSFAGINWSTGIYFIKTETDPNGGTNYSINSTTQLLSVPYALYAENSGSSSPGPQGPAGPTGPQGPSGLLSSGSAAGNTPYWNGSSWVTNSSNIYNNGGNIGIGTNNPQSSLAIEKAAAQIQVKNTIGGNSIYMLPPSPQTTGGIGVDNGDLNLFAGGVDVININQNHHVGIGALANSSGKLFVVNDSTAMVGISTNGAAAYLQGNGGAPSLFVKNLGNGMSGFFENDGQNSTTIEAKNLGLGGAATLENNSSSSSTLNTINNGQGIAGYFKNFSSSDPTIAVFNQSQNAAAYLENNSANVATLYIHAAGGGLGLFTPSALVSGNLFVNGMLSKAGGTFKIDHPLDPENKYLIHSFVESPDMMNIYNGNIFTNESGLATVTLPEYFMAENKDFRYQLTVLGGNGFAMAKVEKKIEGNCFTIRTSEPHTEVSWLVTGIRKDKFAEANRIIPELEKEDQNKGKYLHPELFGKQLESGIFYMAPPEHVHLKNTQQQINSNEQTNKLKNQSMMHPVLLKEKKIK